MTDDYGHPERCILWLALALVLWVVGLAGLLAAWWWR